MQKLCKFSVHRTIGMQGTIKSINNSQTQTGAQSYKKNACYILQDDHLAPLFTVNEIMNMAADLKLGNSISSKRKAILVSVLYWALYLALDLGIQG